MIPVETKINELVIGFMESDKKSLCVFIHFSTSKNIPYYVLLYLKELTLYFDEIILMANKRTIKNENELFAHKIKTILVKNEGYDLGMFYKAFQTINPSDYRQIACINDSNILFNKLATIFKWGEASNLDFWGLIDSNERPSFSTHEQDYHIQSHFIVFNEKAIALLPAFFESLDMVNIFKETNVIKLREKVINQWEIGVSRFMIKNNLRIGSYLDGQIFTDIYLSGKLRNISRRLYPQLINAGYPLIKKKVIVDRQMKYILRGMPSWEKLIRQFGNAEWNIDELIDELSRIRKDSPKRTKNKLKKRLLNFRIFTKNK